MACITRSPSFMRILGSGDLGAWKITLGSPGDDGLSVERKGRLSVAERTSMPCLGISRRTTSQSPEEIWNHSEEVLIRIISLISSIAGEIEERISNASDFYRKGLVGRNALDAGHRQGH